MKRETSDAGSQKSEAECTSPRPSPHAGEGADAELAETFLTRQEMARVLRVSLRTLDTMVAAGEIPCVRLRGRLVRFWVEDVVRKVKGIQPG